jgi:pimeloyl-ACP methyl ester carboxylesterase
MHYVFGALPSCCTAASGTILHNNMTEPRLRHVRCIDPTGLHRMAYWEWGQADNPNVVVCAHGLARQGRDFDTLARELSRDFRVVCPDVVGRGQSDWLRDPMGYAVPTYVADMVTLIARLDVEQVAWVGTSMGGLIGMALASLPGTPVRRLVLNDVGPVIEPAAIARIATYVGQPAHWDTVEQAAADLWQISTSFGPHTPEQWLALTRPQLKAAPQGGWMLHYDPGLAAPVRAATPELLKMGEALLWRSYDAISCPTLLLRGAESDLLSHATAEAMTQRGPRARLVELAGIGHAPTLVAPDQVQRVADFLRS